MCLFQRCVQSRGSAAKPGRKSEVSDTYMCVCVVCGWSERGFVGLCSTKELAQLAQHTQVYNAHPHTPNTPISACTGTHMCPQGHTQESVALLQRQEWHMHSRRSHVCKVDCAGCGFLHSNPRSLALALHTHTHTHTHLSLSLSLSRSLFLISINTSIYNICTCMRVHVGDSTHAYLPYITYTIHT